MAVRLRGTCSEGIASGRRVKCFQDRNAGRGVRGGFLPGGLEASVSRAPVNPATADLVPWGWRERGEGSMLAVVMAKRKQHPGKAGQRCIDWLMDLPPALEKLFQEEIHRYEESRMPIMTNWERMVRTEVLLGGIEVSLEIKFGADGLKLLPEIRELQDVEMLEAVQQAIKTAASPEELRRVWAPERRSRKKRRT
jgi:hypothetical protein